MKQNKTSNDPTALTNIPSIGKSIAKDLNSIGIYTITDLKGKNAEKLYDISNTISGNIQDRCLLYCFRCAIYFAEGGKDPKKLKWWSWKDN